MMLAQISAIVGILRGHDSGWNPQAREDGSLPMSVALRYHAVHMAAGLALAAISLAISLPLFLWLLPASLGLLLSGSISAFSSRLIWGRRARQALWREAALAEENPDRRCRPPTRQSPASR